ncbi:MAG TPA: hypothetical protein VLG67_05240 [Candidatus Saccharimonadales bacterium]|nr:hypothetical protein [Candidatus Saccharimonadales bacterium]
MGYSDYEKVIIKPLVYSDIFDFPLTKSELWKFLISSKAIKKTDFENALNTSINKHISYIDGYFCLKGREKIIAERKNNLKEVSKKLLIVGKTAEYLAAIPSVLLIGISGGLAIGDVNQEDDIDFFVITKKGKLFETRLWILIILQALGLRRKRLDKNTADKICVNLLVDETKIKWSEKSRDIYTAHEILQMKPLFERNNTYAKFIKENDWIKSFFPNIQVLNEEKSWKVESKINSILSILMRFLSNLPLENFIRLLQTSYMHRHMDGEIIEKHALFFHPKDYRAQTIRRLNLKLQDLGLLTKF